MTDKFEKRPHRTLDRTDRRILRELQRDGRLSNVELARRIHLSPTPCLERVRRLEKTGYITGYMARLDPEKLDQGLLVFIEVTLDRTKPDVFARFAEGVGALDAVEECHMVAGGFDYLVKIRIRDMVAYRAFLERFSDLPGVSQTHTYVVMEQVKMRPELVIADT